MYTPKFNLVTDRALLLEVMQTHSFAVLFGSGADGASTATHLPLVVKDEGPHGLLEGHFAKANPHWQSLADQQTLVVFSGPHAYISPTHYAEELSVPTWNYIAVHAYGTLELIEEDDAKDALLKSLIAQHEPAYAERWHALPQGFKRSMLAGIVGFRMPITRIEGKLKLSQNRPAGDRDNIRTAQQSGSPDEQSLAAWMQRLEL
jgi:transcriptional regulator